MIQAGVWEINFKIKNQVAEAEGKLVCRPNGWSRWLQQSSGSGHKQVKTALKGKS